MFIFENIEGNDSSFTEFEITGSTYEPIGEVFLNGQRVKTSEYEVLNELGTICVMCNDSAIDFNEFKQAFEKVILSKHFRIPLISVNYYYLFNFIRLVKLLKLL